VLHKNYTCMLLQPKGWCSHLPTGARGAVLIGWWWVYRFDEGAAGKRYHKVTDKGSEIEYRVTYHEPAVNFRRVVVKSG